VRSTSKTDLALVSFFKPLRYHLDDSARRSYIIFLYQSRFVPKLSPAGVASLLQSLHRQRKHRKRRNHHQQCVFCRFRATCVWGWSPLAASLR